jgi:uncharacterized protein YciI
MDKKYFVLYLRPSRSDFAQTMSAQERAVMTKHVAYWTELMNEGKVLAFGPVLDPSETYGLGIIAVDEEQEVKEFISNDPASTINRYEYFPMRAVVSPNLLPKL